MAAKKYQTKGAAEAAATRAQARSRKLQEQLEAAKVDARKKLAAVKKRLATDGMKRVAVGAGGGAAGGVLVQGVMHYAGRYSASPGIAGTIARAVASPTGAGALTGLAGAALAMYADGKPKRRMLGDIGAGLVAAGASHATADLAQRWLPAGAPAPAVEGFYALPQAPAPARYIPPPLPAPAVEGFYQLDAPAMPAAVTYNRNRGSIR